MAGKAVLVIDMPKSCFDCQLMVDGWCYAVKANRTQETISAKDRTCWCTLRPLPQKKGQYDNYYGYNMMAQGWNECLDAITGETE